MALKNKSMYAILGILSIAESTGYDIKKYSDQVLSGFWNENFGHIYPTLKSMLELEMIEVVPQVKQDKRIKYAITKKGKQEFEAWLLEETDQQPVRSEFMLKLLFSSSQPKENVIHMLNEYKALHQKNKTKYLEMQQHLKRGIAEIPDERSCFLNAVLRRGILSSEAVIKWCDETIEDMKR